MLTGKFLGDQRKLHLCWADVRICLPLQPIPKRCVNAQLGRGRVQYPAVWGSDDRDLATIGHRIFKAEVQQKRQFDITPRKLAWAVPHKLDPPSLRHIGKQTRNLAATNALVLPAGTKCDAEKANPCVGAGDAFGNQRHFWRSGNAFKRNQLHPIADRPNRADKIMANTRGDQRCKIKSIGQMCILLRGLENGAVMVNILEPGMMVRHPQQPDWGLGQVQSSIGHRVTVNFEHAGKVVIDLRQVELMPDFSH